MPRNGSGTFTLVSGNPVVTGTTIESNWANTTLSDIATAMSDSLSRSGQGGMTAALRIADGTQGAPGVGFANETGTGFYRAGTAEAWAVVQGAQTMKLDSTGVTIPVAKATSIEGTFVFNETGADKDARFEGDTDANLLFTDASTDHVGVGTATPAFKLDVNGTFGVSGNSTLGDATTDTVLINGYMGVGTSGTANVGIRIGSSALTGTQQYGTYSNFTSSSAGITFNGGFLGAVNTEAAAYTVNNLAQFYASQGTKGAGSTITSQHGVYIADQSNGASNFGLTSLVSSGSNKFNIYASGTADNYFAGSVGIGTSSPGTKLEVALDDATTNTVANILTLTKTTSGTAASGIGAGILFKAERASGGLVINRAAIYGVAGSDVDDDGDMTFYTLSDTGPSGFTEKLRLTASGNLGLGVTPSVRLHVSGATNLSSRALFDNTANSRTAAIGGNRDTSDCPFVGSTTNHAFAFVTNDTERARITSGGDLLIGATATVNSHKQYISFSSGRGIGINDASAGSGTQVMSFYSAGTQVGNVSVNTTTTSYNTTSDYRLKDNQQPLTNSGAFIDALQPKTWDWKADGSKGVGFIAHEAQGVSPSSVVGEKDAVDEDGKPVMQAMEYGSAEFIANIVAELQSLRARVAALEA